MTLTAWQGTVQNETGDAQANASVEVRSTRTGTPLATLYSDAAGAVPLVNPFTTGADGFAQFWTDPGEYTVAATANASTQTWFVTLSEELPTLTPDTDGVGTPSDTLADIEDGKSVKSNGSGRIGQGPLAGRYVYSGDVLQASSGVDPLVVVLSGQSNAQGVSADGLGGVYRVDNNVKCWDNSASAFVTADLENEVYTTTTGNPYGGGKQNIGVSFAHRLYEQSGRPVFLIVAAQGGQSIDQWIGSGTSSPIYAGMEAVVEAQLIVLGKTAIDFFLWHQGEADASASDGTYRTKLATLIDQLRAEPWFLEYTPFIAGQACPDWTSTANRDRMNAEIGTLLNDGDPNTFVALSDGLTGDGDGTNIHFGNASIDEMGYDRYWRAMWAQSSNIPSFTSSAAVSQVSVVAGEFEDRDYARANYVSQKDVRVSKSNGAVTIKAEQGSLVMSAEGGDDNAIFDAISLRPKTHDVSDLGLASRAWRYAYLTTGISQPDGDNLGFFVGPPSGGQETFRLGSDGRVYNRTSVVVMFDAGGDGFNAVQFLGQDGSARGEITTSYSGLAGSMRFGVRNTGGTTQYAVRIDSDGEFRLPLAETTFSTDMLPNVVVMPDGGIRKSTVAAFATDISSAPTTTGQIAIVAGVGYLATGTASAADWKQITS